MKKGKLIFLVIILMIVGGLVFGISRVMNNPEKYQSSNVSSNVIFDVTQFYASENATVSESKLIEMLGDPDEIEEWDYKKLSKSYPIRTLIYGNYRYNFNSDMLQRISIEEEIPYENKNEILEMFGLKKYKNSDVTDTNSAYRVTNCGVHDFWTQYSDGKLTNIRISYSSLFGN
ncbi:hypothetical protein [Tepidibacter hydrothermalis]|uniref:Uncharacterized protein n=1 Tax=Tepidibacter hydrothermalis TaxID=3036126 RepID=A0ABY8EJF6_9FIRM|nr:hypothetical protein [Tepidibacter hydrothermalis]WFD12250.1 hypothetical protein P4S50_09235 [Tepidibacter hydrothermalis]